MRIVAVAAALGAAACLWSPSPAPAADGDGSPDAAEAPAALVIVDIQEFYFPGGALPLVAPEAAAANAGRLLEHFRAQGLPVIHVGHQAREGGAFAAAVAPAPGETALTKREVNAFKDTPLEERLRAAGAGRVVLCGMQTHMCLEAAARAAADLGFDVTVVGDACATRDLSYRGTTVPAAAVHAATLATLDGVYARVVDTDAAIAEF